MGNMTTRAGIAGLLTGLVTSLLIYAILLPSPDAIQNGKIAGSPDIRLAIAAAVIVIIFGGLFTARWSRSVHPGRCAALAGLAGGLAGNVVFCLWGAATAGLAGLLRHSDRAAIPQHEIIGVSIQQTMGMFLALFIVGSGLGALGGWLACKRGQSRTDFFDKSEPQMALNASITALPASIVAAVIAGAIFSRLADYLGGQSGLPAFEGCLLELPLAVSLLLVLVSHVALTLVVPHEAVQAEALSGMDEVKMGAYVGIGAAPLMILLLILVDAPSLLNPVVVIALLASTGLSLVSLRTLHKLILPGRAAFPAPQEGWQKTQAKLFGSIANSYGPRLVILCIGCGMLMVLPLYVTVISVLINLSDVMGISIFAFIPEETWALHQIQALASTGMVTIAIALLTFIYLIYLNLGRWFSKWNNHRHI